MQTKTKSSIKFRIKYCDNLRWFYFKLVKYWIIYFPIISFISHHYASQECGYLRDTDLRPIHHIGGRVVFSTLTHHWDLLSCF